MADANLLVGAQRPPRVSDPTYTGTYDKRAKLGINQGPTTPMVWQGLSSDAVWHVYGIPGVQPGAVTADATRMRHAI